jgi:hypothetical protein
VAWLGHATNTKKHMWHVSGTPHVFDIPVT